ncbi:MAG: hypothetical protein CSA97_03620, partial [Bacteroidetes bacterium]
MGRNHSNYKPQLSLISLGEALRVHVELPAVDGGNGVHIAPIDLGKGEKHTVDLQSFIAEPRELDANDATKPLSKRIENVLAMSESTGIDKSKTPWQADTNGALVLNRTNKGVRIWCEVLDTVWDTENPDYVNLAATWKSTVDQAKANHLGAAPDPAAYRAAVNLATSEFMSHRRDHTPKLYTISYRKSDGNAPVLSAYLYLNASQNNDIIALKGHNAKGKKFTVPMPNSRWLNFNNPNHTPWNYTYEYAYASFNITATEDNTEVWVYTPKKLYAHGSQGTFDSGELAGEAQNLGNNKHLYKLWFEKAGQSSIILAYPTTTSASSEGYKLSGNPDDYDLGGSIIEVHSGGDVVVTTRVDDVMEDNDYPNLDYVADQLIPERLFGKRYGIIRGMVNGYPAETLAPEYIYVVAREDNTTINVQGMTKKNIGTPPVLTRVEEEYDMRLGANTGTNTDLEPGTPENGHSTITLSRGQQLALSMRRYCFLTLTADKPIGVFQMAGGHSGVTDNKKTGQRAGAMIPPLPEKNQCQGVKSATYVRCNSQSLSLMILAFVGDNGTTSDISCIGGFKLYEDGVELPQTNPTLQILNNKALATSTASPFPGTGSGTDIQNWQPLPNPDPTAYPEIGKWRWLQITINPTQNKTYKLVNTKNVFSLGYINGGSGTEAIYGYFSNFGVFDSNITVNRIDLHTGLGEPLKIDQQSTNENLYLGVCRGESVTLSTPERPGLTYSWSSPEPKINRSIIWPHRANTLMLLPNEHNKVNLKVTGLCDNTAIRTINLHVGDDIPKPIIEAPAKTCAPVGVAGGNLGVKVKNFDNATGIQWYQMDPYEVEFTPSGRKIGGWAASKNGTENIPTGTTEVELLPDFQYKKSVFPNPPPTAQDDWYTMRLMVEAFNDGCHRRAEKEIKLYPGPANPQDIVIKEGTNILDNNARVCKDTEIQVSATPGLGATADLLYRWKRAKGTQAATGITTWPQTQDGGSETLGEFEQTYTYSLIVASASGECETRPVEKTVKTYAQTSVAIDGLPTTDTKGKLASETISTKNEKGSITSYAWRLQREEGTPPTFQDFGSTSTNTSFELKNGPDALRSGKYKVLLDVAGECLPASATGEFTIVPFTVTFNAGDGLFQNASPLAPSATKTVQVEYDEQVAEPTASEQPQRQKNGQDMVVVSWKKGSDDYAFTTGVTEDLELTASWGWAVSMDPKTDGSTPETISVVDGESIPDAKLVPTGTPATGTPQHFIEWRDANQHTVDENTAVDKPLTIIGIWGDEISFNLNRPADDGETHDPTFTNPQ